MKLFTMHTDRADCPHSVRPTKVALLKMDGRYRKYCKVATIAEQSIANSRSIHRRTTCANSLPLVHFIRGDINLSTYLHAFCVHSDRYIHSAVHGPNNSTLSREQLPPSFLTFLNIFDSTISFSSIFLFFSLHQGSEQGTEITRLCCQTRFPARHSSTLSG